MKQIIEKLTFTTRTYPIYRKLVSYLQSACNIVKDVKVFSGKTPVQQRTLEILRFPESFISMNLRSVILYGADQSLK